MKIVLFRHGIALDRDEALSLRIEDHARPLTEKGKEKVKEMAKWLQGYIGKVDLVVSSPLLRAKETAELICPQFKIKQYQQSAELSPSAPPQVFCQWLKNYAGRAETVICVGHEPHLSYFASWILAGSSEAFIDLKKSGVLIAEVESFEDIGPRTAELSLLMTPRALD